MKKKILFIGLLLFSLFNFSSVKANTCTQGQIENASANLSVSSTIEGVPIPTLGRTKYTGRANIYKMTLTSNSKTNSAFCLDGSKIAKSNVEYKIERKLDQKKDIAYYKAYQYAKSNINADKKYSVAQAAIWIINQYGANSLSDKLKDASRDIDIILNCENYLGMIDGDKKVCEIARNSEHSRTLIEAEIRKRYLAKNKDKTKDDFDKDYLPNVVYKTIDATYNDYIKSGSTYNGTLYVWKATNDISNSYQPMIAPLECTDDGSTDDGDSSIEKICTTRDGRIVDYTVQYNTCVSAGGDATTCDTELKAQNCPNSSTRYTVVTRGTSATCSSSTSNYGEYHETVIESNEGTAILGKGDNELNINNYCNLYCIENSAQQVFPGNVRPAVSSGTYIIWPTSESTLSSKYKNQYPLYFTGQKTCYVVMSGEENPINANNIDNAYNILSSNIRNEYGTYARRSYESSRTNGGCESIYSGDNGVCTQKTKEYNTYRNSHTGVLNKRTCLKNAKADHDIDSCIKNGGSTDACTTNYNTAITNCGGELAPTESEILSAIDSREKDMNNCNEEKKACNDYVTAVNNLIAFSDQIKQCATYTPTCSGSSCDIYNYSTNVDLSWGDPEYGTTITDAELEKSKNYSLTIENNTQVNIDVSKNQSISTIKTNTTSLIRSARNITKDRKIIANVNVTYSLPTTNLLYNYVVKRNDSFKSQTERPSSDSNFTTVGFSNLPISYDASTSTLYNLTLSNVKFGDNGQYTPNDYVCNYEVTKTLPSDCLCPPGTKYSGKDLSNIMIDQNKTCYEAQEEYCEKENLNACPDGSKSSEMATCMERYDYFTCYDMNCRITNNDKYCDNDPTINLSACLNNFSYDYCVNLLCNDNGGPYKCKNTNGVDGEMDITSCVYTKMSQGLSKEAAIDACDSLICPLSGLRIIYRTISLENPFPSKQADLKVTQTGLSIGMFNDDVLGRYPGTNWNDKNLVKNHILNVTRNGQKIDGSDIYKNEPLYRFELNTSTIKAIREYNQRRIENGGYADFTLDCKLNNSRACVSEFVHNQELSGLVSGVCMSSTSKNNFYQCSGDS